MIWDALPYLIGAIVVLSFVFLLVLMGVSAWECYQDDRGDEEIQSAWRDLHTHTGSDDWTLDDYRGERARTRPAIPDLTRHMQALEDPADLCEEASEYRTNFGRKLDS